MLLWVHVCIGVVIGTYVYLGVCVHADMGICVYLGVYVHMCMWIPKVSFRYHSSHSVHLVFKTNLLQRSEAYHAG